MNSRDRDALVHDLRRIFGQTTVGSRQVSNLVLAQEHARDWQAPTLPVRDSERGGSSSPRELDERAEDRRVSSQAIRDEQALIVLVPALEAELVIAAVTGGPTPDLAKVARRLADTVNRLTVTVDHALLSEPACRSCARKAKVQGHLYPGHQGVPVYAKAKRHGLCRWCYDFWRAERRLPPVDVVDMYHVRGPRAAGLELAKRLRAKAS